MNLFSFFRKKSEHNVKSLKDYSVYNTKSNYNFEYSLDLGSEQEIKLQEKYDEASKIIDKLRNVDLKYNTTNFKFDIEQLDNILQSTYKQGCEMSVYQFIYNDILDSLIEDIESIIEISNKLYYTLINKDAHFINNIVDAMLEDEEANFNV